MRGLCFPVRDVKYVKDIVARIHQLSGTAMRVLEDVPEGSSDTLTEMDLAALLEVGRTLGAIAEVLNPFLKDVSNVSST